MLEDQYIDEFERIQMSNPNYHVPIVEGNEPGSCDSYLATQALALMWLCEYYLAKTKEPVFLNRLQWDLLVIALEALSTSEIECNGMGLTMKCSEWLMLLLNEIGIFLRHTREFTDCISVVQHEATQQFRNFVHRMHEWITQERIIDPNFFPAPLDLANGDTKKFSRSPSKQKDFCRIMYNNPLNLIDFFEECDSVKINTPQPAPSTDLEAANTAQSRQQFHEWAVMTRESDCGETFDDQEDEQIQEETNDGEDSVDHEHDENTVIEEEENLLTSAQVDTRVHLLVKQSHELGVENQRLINQLDRSIGYGMPNFA
jgi:hypothetical protein